MDHFCFVHAADLHLDTPFEDVHRTPAAIAAALRDASLDAWDGLVQLTIDRGAAFLLLAGDLYDGAERGVRAQVRFRDGLERLAERGVPVFIVLGNHDPLEGWVAIPEWPAAVTIFGSAAVSAVPVAREGRLLATVHGISYGRRECTENLAARFRRGGETGLHIGLLHCNVDGNPDHPAYSPCSVQDLREAGMDYWALGHVHARKCLVAGDPWIVYPGDLQGRGGGPSECGAKGAMVVEVEDAAVRDVAFEPLDRVRFAAIEFDVSGQPDLAAVRRALTERAQRLRGEHPGRGLLVDATLVGRPSFHRALDPSGVALLQELRSDAAAWSPFLWWAAVRDRVHTAVDRDAIRQREDLVAELLRQSEALLQDPTQRSRFLAERFAPLRRKWVAEVEPREVMELLRDAEDVAVDLLLGERVR